MKYLTTVEVAERFRTTPPAVRYWRQKGFGPRGVRMGKKVLYPVEAVEAFEREQAAAESGGTHAARQSRRTA